MLAGQAGKKTHVRSQSESHHGHPHQPAHHGQYSGFSSAAAAAAATGADARPRRGSVIAAQDIEAKWKSFRQGFETFLGKDQRLPHHGMPFLKVRAALFPRRAVRSLSVV